MLFQNWFIYHDLRHWGLEKNDKCLGLEKNDKCFWDIFKSVFLNTNLSILIQIPLKFDPEGPIDIKPASVQVMAWH